MPKWIRNMLAAGLVVLWASPALCEYYQYRDENGVLRFTDDIASVPPAQRPKVTTHQSVVSSPAAGSTGLSAEKNVPAPQASTQPEKLPGSNTWEGKNAKQLAEFDRKQAELDRIFADLQNERAKLEAKAPSSKASFEEKAVYNQKVAMLNAKIERYEKELAAFTQQVNAYNAQVKKSRP